MTTNSSILQNGQVNSGLNKCSNHLLVEGSPKSIRKIYAGFRRMDCFESIIGIDREYAERDWFLHNLDWFGTEWDICPEFADPVLETETFLSVSFMTCWNPPRAFVKRMCEMYQVRAYLQYQEPLMDFSGYVEYDQSGMLIENQDYTFREGVATMDSTRFIARRLTAKFMTA